MGGSVPLYQIWTVEIRRERYGSPERRSHGSAIHGSGLISLEFVDTVTSSIIGRMESIGRESGALRTHLGNGRGHEGTEASAGSIRRLELVGVAPASLRRWHRARGRAGEVPTGSLPSDEAQEDYRGNGEAVERRGELDSG